ncbi:MAG: hypothetical protein FWG68_05535 [Defluviitaleaceae bacterium]|nr:hypothetical protein [Defluviitaleaceae bacterium]
MKTEKITVNLSETEVAQLEFLVAKGLYASRADYIRLAVRRQNELHKGDFDQFLDMPETQPNTRNMKFLGIAQVSKFDLEEYLERGTKLSIKGVGVLNFPKDVSVQLIERTVADFKMSGKIVASEEVKEFLAGKFS